MVAALPVPVFVPFPVPSLSQARLNSAQLSCGRPQLAWVVVAVVVVVGGGSVVGVGVVVVVVGGSGSGEPQTAN